MSDKIEYIDGIPVQGEHIGFAPTEMSSCERCGKANPPNRMDCLYCGQCLVLPGIAAAGGSKFRHAEPEEWEQGANVVVTGGFSDADREMILGTVSVDIETLEKAYLLEPPLPLLKTSEEDAGHVKERLENAGLKVNIFTDRILMTAHPPARLKGLCLDGENVEFILFNGNSVERFTGDGIYLIVSGTILETESESRLKRKGNETTRAADHISSSDHAVIDIYVTGRNEGFRILPHGFDFSCLGERKSMLAVENVQALKKQLRENFPHAVFDDSYANKIGFLDSVWPRSVRNTSKGFHRVGARVQRSIGEVVSNADQFTRYSRMRRMTL